MKINAILNEQQIIKEQILNERTYREFYALGMLLQEYAMTQQQIQQLFQQVADGAARGGNVDKAGDAAVSNRTMLGKAMTGETNKQVQMVLMGQLDHQQPMLPKIHQQMYRPLKDPTPQEHLLAESMTLQHIHTITQSNLVII